MTPYLKPEIHSKKPIILVYPAVSFRECARPKAPRVFRKAAPGRMAASCAAWMIGSADFRGTKTPPVRDGRVFGGHVESVVVSMVVVSMVVLELTLGSNKGYLMDLNGRYHGVFFLVDGSEIWLYNQLRLVRFSFHDLRKVWDRIMVVTRISAINYLRVEQGIIKRWFGVL